MLERDFNAIVRKSLVEYGGFGHKISDVGQIEHGILPFDGFGCIDNRMVVWESKFMNEPMSFNFNRLEEHQIDSLIKVYESFEDKDRILSLFIVGVDFGRNDKRAFIWKNEDLYYIKERKNSKKNILKKELLTLNNYVKIKKSLLDINEVKNINEI